MMNHNLKSRSIPLIIHPDPEDLEAAQVLVEGSINGRLYTFLLDTGAATTTVIADDYTALLEQTGTKDSSGVYGSGSNDLIQIPDIRLGPIFREAFTVCRRVVENPGIHNLIGMDLLKDYRLHFLFDANQVLVDPKAAEEHSNQELFLGKRFHPYIKVQIGDTLAQAVWDTGAGMTIVDQAFIRQHPTFFEAAGSSTGHDWTGAKSDTQSYRLIGAMIGDHPFPVHPVAEVDLSHVNTHTDTPMDMILGYSTIRHANWWFDFPGHRWAVAKMLS
jgi:hypothetical protein